MDNEERMMMEEKTVYRQSFEAAVQSGETDLYHASNEQNRACAEAIDRAIQEQQSEMYSYNTKAAAQVVLARYGAERVAWVLSGSIQRYSDARYSRENIAWAEQTWVPQDISRYWSFQTHPIVLNGFVKNAREIIAELDKIDTPEKLAVALHGFMKDFDPFDYQNTYDADDVEDAIKSDVRDISAGGEHFEWMKAMLTEIVQDLAADNEPDSTTNDYIQQAQSLIDRLNAYAEQHHTAVVQEKEPVTWDMVAAKLDAELKLAGTFTPLQGTDHLLPYMKAAVAYIHRHLINNPLPEELYAAAYNRQNILGEVAHHWMDEAKLRGGDTRDKDLVAAVSIANWIMQVRRDEYTAFDLKSLRLDERSLIFSEVTLTTEGETVTFHAGGMPDTYSIGDSDQYAEFVEGLPGDSYVEIGVAVDSWSTGTGESENASDEEAVLIEANWDCIDKTFGIDHLQTNEFTEYSWGDIPDNDDEEPDDELEP